MNGRLWVQRMSTIGSMCLISRRVQSMSFVWLPWTTVPTKPYQNQRSSTLGLGKVCVVFPLLCHSVASVRTHASVWCHKLSIVIVGWVYFDIPTECDDTLFCYVQNLLSRVLQVLAGSLYCCVLLHSFSCFCFSSALSGATVVVNMPVSFLPFYPSVALVVTISGFYNGSGSGI